MASTLSRMTMRRAAPLARSVHSTPAPLVAYARKVPTSTNKPSAPSRGDFDDILNEVTPPSRPSGQGSSSFSSSAPTGSFGGGRSEGSVSPPLTSLPGENYEPLPSVSSDDGPNWSTSYAGMGSAAFPKESIDVLLRPLDPADIEIKPDGLIYLPEIKYRRVLNYAFGPGGWGLVPRGETQISNGQVSREWGLICLNRLVGVARGEQVYFEASGIPTATEAAKSNALMRCCKDLGIASELWDPSFIRKFKQTHAVEVFAKHTLKGTVKKQWRLKNSPKLDFPWKE